MTVKKCTLNKLGIVTLSTAMFAGGFLPTAAHAQTANQATTIDTNGVDSAYVSEILSELESIELNFNLSSSKPQEQVIQLDNGEEVTVGIKSDLNSRANYSLSQGTSSWTIYFTVGYLSVQFKTKINLTASGTSSITSASDAKYTAAFCDITSDKLTKTSTSATYTVKGKVTGGGFTIYSFSHILKASVKGKTLTTSFS